MDRSALNKATSADDTPTPGYLYTEIAQSTFADLNACQQLADYLIKKLEKDNPHVKLKCLKIIKHVCEQGKPEFKRAIQRKAEVVKACLQYRGTPDPLKGDAPNKAVREEADLAVKAVFSSNASLNAYGFSTGQGKKMQGFGSEPSEDISSRIGNLSSNSFSGGGGSSFEGGGGRSFGSGGMVGFGNPNFENAPPRKDDDSVFNKAMSSTMSAVSYLQSKVTGAPPPPLPSGGSDGTYRPPPVGSGFGGPSPGGGCGGDRSGFGSSGYGGGSGYSAPSHSYSSAGTTQQNYGIHGPGGANRRWGHRNEHRDGEAREARGERSEATATPEAAPKPPPAMVDLLDMEEPSSAEGPGASGASASLLDEAPSAASQDLLGGGADSLIGGLDAPSQPAPAQAEVGGLMGSIDMANQAPQGAPGGCGCGGCPGGMPNSGGMGMGGMGSSMGMGGSSMGGSMGSQAPPGPMSGGSMGSSMGAMGQPGAMGNAMGMGGMGNMGPMNMGMGMGGMGCGMGAMGMGCGGCMGGPQMNPMGGCGCGQMGGMGAMGCGPPMGGPMGMGCGGCGGCQGCQGCQGSMMGGCAPNMGMGMMPQQMQPMQSMNQPAYSPPASSQPPYQNGNAPMAMGSMSTPSGGASAFSFIGGGNSASAASPSISPAAPPQTKPPDMAFGFVAEEMKGAVG